jgi:hypothetical protein
MEDIDLLSEALRSQSLSDREIVLPYQEALQALDILVRANWALLGWEGWEKDAEGRHGHSSLMGTMSIEQEAGEKWEDYVQRSAGFCRETMKADQDRWKREGRDTSRTLYFCLTATAKAQS